MSSGSHNDDGNNLGRGTPSSYGSYQKQGKGSYNNSSDESTAARGGSGSHRGSNRGSFRGRG